MEPLDLSKEIIFGSSEATLSRKISNLEKTGKLRKLLSRVYTTNTIDSPENIVRRNILDILVWRFPGCIISFRSALEMKTTASGNFFLTYKSSRRITDIPGVIVNLIKGPAALSSDIKFGNLDIFVASESRWMLECLQRSKSTAEGENRSFPKEFIENRLEKMLQYGDESRLNDFRDATRDVADRLGLEKEFDALNEIISALLNTHEASILQSEPARARSAGVPFDLERDELFAILRDALADSVFRMMEDNNKSEGSFRMFSFLESYFSNYIEGTEFQIEEALQIVDSGIPIPKRVKDSHDILGTFKVLSNRAEMSKIPANEDDLIAIIKGRHATMMSQREECTPGVFNTMRNRAGMTEFVDPKLVDGTLRRAFKYYVTLTDPLARAIFMMFMCSETHPFVDGNGRVSRIMMNAELVHAGYSRIIVPTVFREDYLLTLRKLSRQKQPEAFIRVMERLQQFSHNIYGDNFEELKDYLIACNAMNEPQEGKLLIIERYFPKD